MIFKPNITRLFVLLCFVIPIIGGLSSCSNTRYLAEGESLYTGSKIKIEDSVLTKGQKKDMAESINEIIRPRRNRQFLGLKIKLWFYNIAGKREPAKGLRNWLKNKVGEPPVLGSDFDVKTNQALIDNFLGNQGYFSTATEADKITKRKRTTSYFTVYPGIQDTIQSVSFDFDTATVFGRDLIGTKDSTLLQPGKPYNLDTIIAERERITQRLKNRGYFYFNPEFILIKADTGIGLNKVALSLVIKDQEISDNAKQRYRINQVIINPNYQMSTEASDQKNVTSKWWNSGDTTFYPLGYGIIERRSQFKPYVFKQLMQLRPSQFYSLTDQNMALNRLVTIGAFKFVKNDFRTVPGINAPLLNVTYLLSPYPKQSLSFDLGAYTQNDNRVGSRASISWLNHNIFHGAELLTVKLSGGFDMQYGGELTSPNIYTFGLDLGLNIPRFIVPFFKVKSSTRFVPRTLVNLSYNLTLAPSYYEINSFSLGLGYAWKESMTKEHKFFPINISYVKTDTINSAKADQFNLSNLTFKGLIFGPTYEYTYNSQLGNPNRVNNFYFDGQADLSGNILGWIQGTSLSRPSKEILGQPYAQYFKVQTDFRFYHYVSKQKIIALRGFLGAGLPYGNSESLPNIKQFFSGGSNSLRGFSTRLVGPGSYYFKNATNNALFLEMLGDLKLEMNVEYRMPVYQFINASFFADAGNIWLYRKNAHFPGGEISPAFLSQLAVDAGAGLRLDFKILVLRLDLGFPIRKPWLDKGQRWQFSHLDFGNGTWRKDNIFFNLAIGYPF